MTFVELICHLAQDHEVVGDVVPTWPRLLLYGQMKAAIAMSVNARHCGFNIVYRVADGARLSVPGRLYIPTARSVHALCGHRVLKTYTGACLQRAKDCTNVCTVTGLFALDSACVWLAGCCAQSLVLYHVLCDHLTKPPGGWLYPSAPYVGR